jgi:hypothetical protein
MFLVIVIAVYTPADKIDVLRSAPTGGDRAGKVVGMREKKSVLVGRRMRSLVARTIHTHAQLACMH